MSELVAFDLETGGTQCESRFYTDLEWSALHESRRPDVTVRTATLRRGIAQDGGTAGGPHNTHAEPGWWCPPSPTIQIAALAIDATTFETIDEFDRAGAVAPERVER